MITKVHRKNAPHIGPPKLYKKARTSDNQAICLQYSLVPNGAGLMRCGAMVPFFDTGNSAMERFQNQTKFRLSHPEIKFSIVPFGVLPRFWCCGVLGWGARLLGWTETAEEGEPTKKHFDII